MNADDRVPLILEDLARFARSATRVAARGYAAFVDADDDDQRRIARSIVVDVSTAADRLPEGFRSAHPEIDWKGIRSARNFIVHDYDGTDEDILWQAITVEIPEIMRELGLETR